MWDDAIAWGQRIFDWLLDIIEGLQLSRTIANLPIEVLWALPTVLCVFLGARWLAKRKFRKAKISSADNHQLSQNTAPPAVMPSDVTMATHAVRAVSSEAPAPGVKKPRLVLFIHGLLGSPQSFGKFPELLRADPDIAAQFDVDASFAYATSVLAISRSTHLSQVAQELKTVIDNRFRDYSEIVVFAHSMGGLVARRYIADALMAKQTPRITRVIYFATPHMGALAAKLGSIATAALSSAISAIPGGGIVTGAAATAVGMGPSEQVAALAYDSRFLQDLMQDEAACGARDKVWAKFLLAANDIAVGTTSAWGPGGPSDFEVVPGTNHSSLVCLQSNDHLSYKIARQVLLAANVRLPWHAEPDSRQPNLLRKDYAQTEADRARNRFIYWNRALPFIGRDGEEKAFARFLDDPKRRFRWLLISGSGGMGKSRLALELVLSQASGWWHAGFLDPEQASAPDWTLWQPRLPTLMVVDYAGRDDEPIAKLLKGLAERESPHLLRYPVRVVLIERDAKGAWLDTIVGASLLVAGETTRAPDLQLGPIDDAWPIFEHVLGQASATAAGRAATLAKLAEIDKQSRPLFAYLMADAMRNGGNVRAWDRGQLLHDVLQREQRNFWLPAAKLAGQGDRPSDIAKERRALALATMAATRAAPLTRSEIEDCRSPLLPTWDIDRHPSIFAAMTGADTRNAVVPLEPDIIGEYFVLEVLSDLAESDAKALVELAWQVRPEQVWWFISRCAEDFPAHPTFRKVLEVQPRTPRGRKGWAMAVVDVIHFLGGQDRRAAHDLYDHLKRLTDAHNEADLREEQAKAAFNLVNAYCRTNDLDGAYDLYEQLKGLSGRYDEAGLRKRQVRAAFSLISVHLPNHQIDVARERYDEIDRLGARYDEIQLHEEQAWAANMLLHYVGNPPPANLAPDDDLPQVVFQDHPDLEGAHDLHDQIVALVRHNPTSLRLRSAWANALGSMVSVYINNGRRELAEELQRQIAAEPADEDVAIAAEIVRALASRQEQQFQNLLRQVQQGDQSFADHIIEMVNLAGSAGTAGRS